jgi:hypothetical protein
MICISFWMQRDIPGSISNGPFSIVDFEKLALVDID